MGAQIETPSVGETRPWRVVCNDHDLDRLVDTERHALNLQAKHDREDHPQAAALPTTTDTLTGLEVNLTALAQLAAAAGTVRRHLTDPTEAMLIIDSWCLLVGLEEAEALALAARITEQRETVVAHVAPF